MPLPGALQATTLSTAAVNGNGRAKKAVKKEESDYEQDTPQQPKKRATKTQRAPPKKRAKKEEADIESEDDASIALKNGSKKQAVKKEEQDAAAQSSEDEKPLKKAKKAPAKRAKKEGAEDESSKPKKGKAKKEENGDTPAKKGRKKKEEEEAEVFRWWENQTEENDGSIKWNTLEHNGVYFPPAYEPLPKNVKMKYDGMCPKFSPCSSIFSHYFRQVNRSTFPLSLKKSQVSMAPCLKLTMRRTPYLTRISLLTFWTSLSSILQYVSTYIPVFLGDLCMCLFTAGWY